MRTLVSFIAVASLIAACGDSGSESESGPGALVDNLLWVPTQDGQELFGVPPEGKQCPLEPEGECPVPEDDCVVVPPGGTCVISFVAECLDQFTVLSVYTQRPDGSPLCNWITLEQPSLRWIREGEEVEVRAFYFPLTSPIGGQARIGLAVDDQIAVERIITIPQPFDFITSSWIADRDYPPGTRILFHVDNHGNNEYGLVEANVCADRVPGDRETLCVREGVLGWGLA